MTSNGRKIQECNEMLAKAINAEYATLCRYMLKKFWGISIKEGRRSRKMRQAKRMHSIFNILVSARVQNVRDPNSTRLENDDHYP